MKHKKNKTFSFTFVFSFSLLLSFWHRIFLLSAELSTLLSRQNEQWQIPSIPACLTKCCFSFACEAWFSRKQNSRWVAFSFQRFKNYTLLFSCLPGFWREVRSNSYSSLSISAVPPSPSASARSFTLSGIFAMHCYRPDEHFWYLSSWVPCELPEAMVWCPSLILENSCPFSLQLFFCPVLSPSSGFPILRRLHSLELPYSSWMFLF